MSVASKASLLLLLALTGGITGCRQMMMNGENPPIPPGLEPLYQQSAPVIVAPMAAPAGPRWSPDDQPFFAASITGSEAENLLADDMAALRFLAMKQIADQGQTNPDDSRRRRNSNLGALLPLTYPTAPAAEILVPLPVLADLLALWKELEAKGSAGQKAFFLDRILPAEPAKRQALAPVDGEGCRALKKRLDRLEKTGLISPSQREAEDKALDRLLESGLLPDKYQPPAPPPPPPAKKKTGGSGSGARMPGGVSGRLEVIPSPSGVEAPKLTGKESGPVGIHLLSMGSASHGDKAWEALKNQFPELATLSFKVAKADLGDLGVTYRLIAGPLEKDAAGKICTALKAKGQSCSPTPFP